MPITIVNDMVYDSDSDFEDLRKTAAPRQPSLRRSLAVALLSGGLTLCAAVAGLAYATGSIGEADGAAPSARTAVTATLALDDATGLFVETDAPQSCSAKCHRQLASELSLCSSGATGCKKPAHHRHFHCCEQCPGGACAAPAAPPAAPRAMEQQAAARPEQPEGRPALFPCSARCKKTLEDALMRCKPGDMGCKKPARHNHRHCVEQCSCSDTCHRELHEALGKCVTPGQLGCKKPAHHHHRHCCEKCPSSTC